MGESLTEQCRVNDEGLRIVKFFYKERKSCEEQHIDGTLGISHG